MSCGQLFITEVSQSQLSNQSINFVAPPKSSPKSTMSRSNLADVMGVFGSPAYRKEKSVIKCQHCLMSYRVAYSVDDNFCSRDCRTCYLWMNGTLVSQPQSRCDWSNCQKSSSNLSVTKSSKAFSESTFTDSECDIDELSEDGFPTWKTCDPLLQVTSSLRHSSPSSHSPVLRRAAILGNDYFNDSFSELGVFYDSNSIVEETLQTVPRRSTTRQA